MSDVRDIRTALVTGATGFIGQYLVRKLLDMGVSVSALVRDKRKFPDFKNVAVEWIEGDITSSESLDTAVKGVDTVFHTAAVLGPAYLDDSVYRSVNAEGTEKLIQSCRQAGCVERFVHVSSVGVLGPLDPKEVACEGTPPKPVDIYEITKLEGENIALQAAKDKFPVVIARPAWVYGPNDQRTLKLFRMIARRKFMLIGRAQNKQHPVWIEDIVDGLIRCATVCGIEGRVYHLAGSEILTIESLCRIVADAANVTIPKIRPCVWMIQFPALLIEKLFKLWNGNPPVDHRKVDFFIVNRAYSIRRAKAELNWEPAVKFKDGIVRTLDWYKSRNLL